MHRQIWALFGGTILITALIRIVLPPTLGLLALIALVGLGTTLFIRLLRREDVRIRRDVARVTEQEAVTLAMDYAFARGWSWGEPEVGLRFENHPEGAGPTWEVSPSTPYLGVRKRIWVDVQTGEVLDATGPLPR